MAITLIWPLCSSPWVPNSPTPTPTPARCHTTLSSHSVTETTSLEGPSNYNPVCDDILSTAFPLAFLVRPQPLSLACRSPPPTCRPCLSLSPEPLTAVQPGPPRCRTFPPCPFADAWMGDSDSCSFRIQGRRDLFPEASICPMLPPVLKLPPPPPLGLHLTVWYLLDSVWLSLTFPPNHA